MNKQTARLEQTNLYVDLASFSTKLESWLYESVGDIFFSEVSSIDPLIKLHPEEEKYVQYAVVKRKAEFASGRSCARKVLAKLGYFEIPILVGPKGEPLWPEGISGSISHDQGIAVAAASASRQYVGLGIDLLSCESRIESGGSELIADDSEISEVGSMLVQHTPGTARKVDPLLLIFSAKESAIKAVSPSLGHYLDFREIRIEPCTGNLRAVFEDLDIYLTTHWTLINGIIVTFTCFFANPTSMKKYSESRIRRSLI